MSSTGFLSMQCANILFMGESNERLKMARINAGFASARSAALRFGWKPSTYASHENSQGKSVPLESALIYADKFGVSPAWILTGEIPPDFIPDDARLVRAVRQASDAKKDAIALLLGLEPDDSTESPKPPASSEGRRTPRPK